MFRRISRIFLIVLSCIVAIIAVLALSGAFLLRGSLPRLDGEKAFAGLDARVEVERDALGVPDIQAEGRRDAAFALGYLHAQDRFFQMDLQRRSASGELAELLGAQLIETDRRVRIHRFRDLASRVIEASSQEHKSVLDGYTEGVNAGLEDLGARPFEYFVLRKKPEPWRPEDTILTLCAMFLDLSLSTADTEQACAMVADILPKALSDYLLTPAARWDAPLQEGYPFPAPMPDSTQVDMRKWLTKAALLKGADAVGIVTADVGDGRGEATESNDETGLSRLKESAGSNNWAVAGSLTAHGGALLANDMHLAHGIPNIWYRARWSWLDGGEERSVAGVTLPGTPAMVVGSNGCVSWGFTNGYFDGVDLVRLEIDPSDSTRYMTPGGWEKFELIPEIIDIAGSRPDTIIVKQTRWGPVWTFDSKGDPMALRWTAHDIEGVNLALIALENVRNIDEAVIAAAQSGIPPQNFVCADREGDIAWTAAGRLPKRTGWDGRLPVSWADGSCRWDGYIGPEDQPKIVRPAEGRLWTANNRVTGGHYFSVLGDGGYGLGARARQIRDGLRAVDQPDELDMLALQLDDRALFIDEWREIALEALDGDTTASRREFARVIAEDWSGHASIESAGYRLMSSFVNRLQNIIYHSLTGPIWTKHPRFRSYWLSYRHSISWELLQKRPPHLLLPLYHKDWDEVLIQAVDEAIERVTRSGLPMKECTWGEANIVDVSHPFVRFAPRSRRWLAAPAVGMPGGSHMPRVQHRRHGASERMVVSPGREENGILHMPGGQSGHPMSKFFLAGHEDWLEGKASSLLPGEPVHRLSLVPERD